MFQLFGAYSISHIDVYVYIHVFISVSVVPGKPVAYNNGLLSINYGLLWSIVACCFELLGVPARIDEKEGVSESQTSALSLKSKTRATACKAGSQ